MPRYVAVAPIRIGWALAYAEGDPVSQWALDEHPEWAEYVTEVVEPTPEPPAAVFAEPAAEDAPPARKTASTKG